MNSTSVLEQPTKQQAQRTNTRKNAHERAALIAAVAGGMSQAEAAQHFNIHRNTVQRWCSQVRKVDNAVNPLRKEWKDTARTHAQQAVINGLKYKRDPYKAANIGVKVLEGLGDLVSGSTVQVNNTRIEVSWSGPMNVTPDTQQDTQHVVDVPGEDVTITRQDT